MINPEMVMIGTQDGSLTGDAEQLKQFYESIMENDPRYEIGTWDECECIKVFYNTFISAKIGLVNMIQDVAVKQGNINVDVVTDALAKSTQRIMGKAYMKAGMGDGGACHPRDNIALRYMASQLDLGYDIFDAIMNAREIQAKNIADLLVKISKEHELPILLNGIAYKPGVPYIDGSYSLLVGHYCADQGRQPMQIDPVAIGEDKNEYRAVVLLAHPTLYGNLTSNSIVVDPWRQHTSNNYKVIHYGNTRKN
jgi:UDPglucose 6-dehydrogenase